MSNPQLARKRQIGQILTFGARSAFTTHVGIMINGQVDGPATARDRDCLCQGSRSVHRSAHPLREPFANALWPANMRQQAKTRSGKHVADSSGHRQMIDNGKCLDTASILLHPWWEN